MKVVLVTGSREWNDKLAIFNILDLIDPDAVIHGGSRGADTIAEEWAIKKRVSVEPYPVSRQEWEDLGKRAGHLRNMTMADRLNRYRNQGNDVLVLAFPLPESRGTKDMMDIAISRGFPVLRYQ